MKEVSCKVLLYLKRSSLTASGQAPIMCRVTVVFSTGMLQSKIMQISEIELNRDLFSVQAK